MRDTPELLYAVPVLPFIGFLLLIFGGRALPKFVVSVLACGLVAGSFALSVMAFTELEPQRPIESPEVEWIMVPGAGGSGHLKVDLPWALYVDYLSGVMLLVVTGVGFLIHLYSTGYMAHDPRFSRFFAYLNLFTAFMLMLVLGRNLMVMFVGWEGVGLCSYLLIGFWYDKTGTKEAGTGNALAGNKAFIVNRIGDWGFTVGVLLLFVTVGAATGVWTLDIPTLKTHVGAELGVGVLTAIGIFLFIGATGKSAQIPLYVWLPDAMAGPTPVSALIHAATMVTAGVYMVCRMHFLFEAAPAAMTVVAVVGALTAFVAATIGICQNDIKKVLAYSTVSQLGFMFIAAGVGAYAVAIFHVVTHAFFKACLFLGSGSVIHGCHDEQDIRHMGGLRKSMPITAYTFLISCIAIAGVPWVASGFWSKDAILSTAVNLNKMEAAPWVGPLVCSLGLASAVLTAFYMFRLYFLTFEGEYRGHGHPHESPWTMWVPLAVLATLSVVGGWPFMGVLHAIEHALPLPEHADHNTTVMILSIGAALGGIFAGWHMYMKRKELPDQYARRWPELYALVRDKYRVDEAYWAALVNPLLAADQSLGEFDNNVIDGAVNGSGEATAATSNATGYFDNEVVDGMVNGTAEGVQATGRALKKMQTGNIKTYIATAVAGGLFVIFFYLALEWRAFRDLFGTG